MILFALSELGSSSWQLYLRWIPQKLCLSSQNKEGRRTCDSQNSAHCGSKHQTGFSEMCEPRRSPYPVIHLQDEYVFSKQLLWVGKTKFFVFIFCYLWHQQNLRPLREQRALFMVAKVLIPVVCGSDHELWPGPPVWRGREFPYSRRPKPLRGGQLASATGLSPKGMNRKCRVWTSCPALFGHPENSFRNLIPTMTCEAVGPMSEAIKDGFPQRQLLNLEPDQRPK